MTRGYDMNNWEPPCCFLLLDLQVTVQDGGLLGSNRGEHLQVHLIRLFEPGSSDVFLKPSFGWTELLNQNLCQSESTITSVLTLVLH